MTDADTLRHLGFDPDKLTAAETSECVKLGTTVNPNPAQLRAWQAFIDQHPDALTNREPA